jgi:hypothetical protein
LVPRPPLNAIEETSPVLPTLPKTIPGELKELISLFSIHEGISVY